MSLLPDNASFHEHVEACFVAYRGRGLSLSAVDVELVDAWARLEVPFEVVARGIRKAAEHALWDAPEGEGRLRSLKAARKHVEAEIQKYVKRVPSAGLTEVHDTEPFHLVRHKRLLAALKKAQSEHPEVAGPLARLCTLAPPHDFAAANRREELSLALLARALPFAERTSLLRNARRLVENAQTTSQAARLESLRFHRAALVRHRWSIPSFW